MHRTQLTPSRRPKVIAIVSTLSTQQIVELRKIHLSKLDHNGRGWHAAGRGLDVAAGKRLYSTWVHSRSSDDGNEDPAGQGLWSG